MGTHTHTHTHTRTHPPYTHAPTHHTHTYACMHTQVRRPRNPRLPRRLLLRRDGCHHACGLAQVCTRLRHPHVAHQRDGRHITRMRECRVRRLSHVATRSTPGLGLGHPPETVRTKQLVPSLWTLQVRTKHPAPGTRHPAPGTRHPAPGTRHPAPCTLHPAPCRCRGLRGARDGAGAARRIGLAQV